jgi:hypothetical protein
MIGNILVFLAAAAFFFVVLQVFLSNEQHKALAHRLIGYWLTIDSMKSKVWLERLRYPRTTRLMLAFAMMPTATFFVGAYFNQKPSPDGEFEVLYPLLLMTISFTVGWATLRFALAGSTLLQAALRASLALMICLVPIIAVFTWSSFNMALLRVNGDITTLQTLWVGIFITLFLLSAGVVIIWCGIAAPLFITAIFHVCLVVAEFVVRRITEYEKGPVAAAGLLFGAAAALLKALSPS